MSGGTPRPRKRASKDDEAKQKIIYAAAQTILRAGLDALLWWVTGKDRL
jgi:DNA-binding transcriptional regulator YbjK